MKEKFPFRVLITASPVILLEAVFFLGPLLIVLGLSVVRMEEFNLVYEFTLNNYLEAVINPINRRAWINTLLVSIGVTIVSEALAYPLAYYIASVSRRRNVLLFLVMIPFWVNYVIRLNGWRLLLARRGMINHLLKNAGAVSEPISWLIDTRIAVAIGQISLVLPFAVLPLYVNLKRIDRNVIEAAYDLGASPFQVFRRVIVPLSYAGLAVGLMFMTVFNLGMFLSPRLLGQGLYVGSRINTEFGTVNWPSGAALAIVLMGVILVVLGVLLRTVDFETVLGTHSRSTGDDISRTGRSGNDWTGVALSFLAGLMYAFMYLPFAAIVLFSFEDGQYPGFPWDGFTLGWYARLIDSSIAMTAIQNSFLVASAVTTIATGIGLLGAIALVRFTFRTKRMYWGLLIAPLTIPWLVLGISLLFMLSILGIIPGLHTVVLGQLVFIVPVVVLTISANLRRIDLSLEESARDLGASEWMTYRKITIPLLAPGIISGALLAFGLSLNDYLIAFFTSGVRNTLPIWLSATISQGHFYITYAASALTIVVTIAFVSVLAVVWPQSS